jgi:hypothetical protein
VEPARVPVEAILSMWRAGEPPDVVADEYGLSIDQVNALIRSQPEFFADRCLGRGASRLLRDQGWIVHDITDHFANDAQDVSDPDCSGPR